MTMLKHEQRSHLGINLGAVAYLLLCIGQVLGKLEDAAWLAYAATPTPLLLGTLILPSVPFSIRVLLPLPKVLEGTNTTPYNWSLQMATTSAHMILPPPLALLFTLRLSSRDLILISDLLSKAW